MWNPKGAIFYFVQTAGGQDNKSQSLHFNADNFGEIHICYSDAGRHEQMDIWVRTDQGQYVYYLNDVGTTQFLDLQCSLDQWKFNTCDTLTAVNAVQPIVEWARSFDAFHGYT